MPCEAPEDILQSLKAEQRLLALDLGEKTIGLAVSDRRRSIATPLKTIRRAKAAGDMAKLKDVLAAQECGGIVIGYPVNMDGSLGPKCQSVRQFARNLEAAFALPVVLWDERMSTMAVTRTMLEADISRAKRAEHVDKLAAAYILQGCLDYLNARASHAG